MAITCEKKSEVESGLDEKDAVENGDAEVAQSKTASSIEEPPDGGLLAWLQVAGSFALFFNSWGVINTFGVYQTYFEEDLLKHKSPDAISWIGSIQSFLLLIVGVVSGPLYDMGYFTHLIILGTILLGLGFMMTSLCTQYWQFMLSQSICIGIGTGFLYIPAVALLPQYFSSKRAIANGIATSGSSFGGVIYPLIFQRLLSRVSFAWTNRAIGFISLATCSFALAVMRPRGKPSSRRSLVDVSAFKDAPYVLFCAARFFSYVGFFGPIFYLQPYALSHGLKGQNLALYLVAILNAASVPGRIIPSWFSRTIGPINMMLIMGLIAGIICFGWIAVDDKAGNVVIAVMYGFASGGIIALPGVVLANLVPDIKLLGTWMGMCSVISAFGSLCGTPVAGAILKGTGSFLGVQLFAALAIITMALFLGGARVAKAGAKLLVVV